MDDFEKYEKISEAYLEKRNQLWKERCKKCDDNRIEYAKKLFEFFDAEENQELINEFINDVMLVMELDKDEKGKIHNGKRLDEIRAILVKNNSDALTKNETLTYDLNDLYKAIAKSLENKMLKSVLMD
jgi:DNA-directed RNA polymerase subunit F